MAMVNGTSDGKFGVSASLKVYTYRSGANVFLQIA